MVAPLGKLRKPTGEVVARPTRQTQARAEPNPITPDGWGVFLESLRRSTNGSVANLIRHDLQSHKGNMMAAANADPEGARLYQQDWASQDPWAYSPRQTQLRQGSVSVGEALIQHSDLRRTAFYSDFGRHYDIVRMIGGVIEKNPAATSVLSVTRAEQLQPFGRGEVTLFKALLPHVQRALQLHRRLIDAEEAAEDLAWVMNTTRRALFLIDSQGTIRFANEAAVRIIAMRDGLTIDHAELRTARGTDTARLRAMIAEAIRTSNGEGLASGGSLAIGRPSGRRAFTALVSPISRERTLRHGVAAAAIVSVIDPEQVALPDEPMLRSLFGLTPAEAALTQHLASGCSLAEAADRFGLHRETVRSRLKAIFEKTGTHRQAELVRLVLNATP